MPHVQIRNMPDPLHRKLKARAAAAGVSLSGYLLEEVERAAELPTLEDWVASVRSGSQLTRLKSRPADVIRRDRSR